MPRPPLIDPATWFEMQVEIAKRLFPSSFRSVKDTKQEMASDTNEGPPVAL